MLSPSLVGEYQICQRRGHTAVTEGTSDKAPTYCGYFTCPLLRHPLQDGDGGEVGGAAHPHRHRGGELMATIICFYHPRDHRMGPVRGCALCIGIRDYVQQEKAA